MINLEYKEEIIELRSDVSEITVEEMEYIVYKLTSPDFIFIDTWREIINYLGVPNYVIDWIEFDTMIDIKNSFNFKCESEIVPIVNIEGVEYTCYSNGKLRLSIKKLDFIFEEIVRLKSFYLARVMAICYSDDWSVENLDYLESWFKKQPASLSIPISDFVSKSIIKKLELTNV